ncbi:MAG: hypothetical protein FJY54_18855 [Betaproteobacteria bacterium]|nr:hypothetical protein [Betaproteobacteria bacterium]
MAGQNRRRRRRAAERVCRWLVQVHQYHLAESGAGRTPVSFEDTHFDSCDPTMRLDNLPPLSASARHGSRTVLGPRSNVEELGLAADPMAVHHLDLWHTALVDDRHSHSNDP